MLHLLKKLKLYTKVGSESVHKTSISIQIKIYLWSFVDYQHLQKYFYNWNMILNYCSIYKINIRGNFIWKYPSSNFHISTRLSHFEKKSNVLAVPMIMSFKVLKHFFSHKVSFSIWFPVATRSQTRKNIFSEILTHTTVGFFQKKTDDLWLEFVLFGS